MSGELAVHEKQVGAVDIALESRNFELIDNELGDLQLNSSLKVTGELRRPKIVGNARVEAGRLEVDRVMQLFYDPYSTEAIPEIVSAERVVEGTGSAEEATKAALKKAQTAAAPPGAEQADMAPPAPAGFFAPLELDVRLEIPDNLVLRGQELRPAGPTGAALGAMNVTVGGDVRLLKKPAEPIVVLGTVQTVRGTYEFQGRRFDLVRGGQIRFIGETEINPLIDITATRLIPNTGVEARVHVTGSLKVPELELTSNPPLEESDILALIVFNRPVNELGAGERSSLAATAGGIATGFIAAPLGESIGRALDLDLFEITTTTGPRRSWCGRHARPPDRRPCVRQAAPAVRRAQRERVHDRVSAVEIPAPAGDGRPRNDRLRKPPEPAPHRARRHRPVFLFQLLS